MNFLSFALMMSTAYPLSLKSRAISWTSQYIVWKLEKASHGARVNGSVIYEMRASPFFLPIAGIETRPQSLLVILFLYARYALVRLFMIFLMKVEP